MSIFNQPFGITWRKALLSAPRLVPDLVLHYTSPDGPHPIIINLPSRGSYKIPLYVFIPPNTSSISSTSSNTTSSNAPLPVLVDFHGGGFIFGSCQEQAPWCALMSRELGAIAISVDYRMGPASQFPAAVEDAEDVLRAVLTPGSAGYVELRDGINKYLKSQNRDAVQLDAEKIAVSGFSSGGNLALNLGLDIKKDMKSIPPIEKDWPSVFPEDYGRQIPLLLFYPSFDARQLPSERPRPPGMEEKKSLLQSLRLETELMPTYLPRAHAAHLRASPGLAATNEGGLHKKARMYLVAPELDTLSAQTEIWIKKVEREGRGGDLKVRREKGMVHGWTQFPDGWLEEEARMVKMDVFKEAKELVEKAWRDEEWS